MERQSDRMTAGDLEKTAITAICKVPDGPSTNPAVPPARILVAIRGQKIQSEDTMVTFAQLHAQNHKITELSNVFLYLIQDRAMCDTQTACNVFFDYWKNVKDHVETVDRELCTKLISQPDQAMRNTADRFLSGSSEIKRIFSGYLKDWCSEQKKELTIKNHKEFAKDTEQMFSLVLDRIQRETEHLYPLIRKLEGKDQQAA